MSDCSVVALGDGLNLVQSVDYFFPSVDDPVIEGQIACANVLSDLYAFGVEKIDNMLMIIGVGEEFNAQEQDDVTAGFIEGFKAQATCAGTVVTGGQTTMNPVPILGGIATAVVHNRDLLEQGNARAGQVLVLTKPLGTQVATNIPSFLHTSFSVFSEAVSSSDLVAAYNTSVDSMRRLNKNAAALMKKYRATACTDITGFGLLGHATNLLHQQKTPLDFEIHTLPIITHTDILDDIAGLGLLTGESLETSGGLLITMDPDDATAFIIELHAKDGWPAWIIGDVKPGTQQVSISSTPKIEKYIRSYSNMA